MAQGVWLQRALFLVAVVVIAASPWLLSHDGPASATLSAVMAVPEDSAEALDAVRGTVQGNAEWTRAVVRRLPAESRLTPTGPLPHLGRRTDMAHYVVASGFKRGVEIGVQRGEFARTMVSEWAGHGLDLYALVDVWAPQENYLDVANVDLNAQEDILKTARRALAAYANDTLFLRMYSVEAARWFEPESLDFVYVDARHDYCGVTEDLVAYWPLLRSGGLMAGHDYLTNSEMKALLPRTTMDWSVCADGSVHPGAVKGAVLDFVARQGIAADAVLATNDEWPSFYLTKP